MYKHAKCRYYFPNVFSQIKTQTWCFQIYSLWSWNMRWAFTRSSETVKQPVLLYALVWFSHPRGPHTLIWCGKSPFHPRSRCFVSAWVLDLHKNKGWFTVEKVPFLWSIIYPANFGTFNAHLELEPSGISPLLVFFWPSIRRYRIEYLALYAVLATKYLCHTHNWLSYSLPKWRNPYKPFSFLSATIRPRGSLRKKSRASGTGAGGIVRVGKSKLTFHCFFFCACVFEVFLAAWNNIAGCFFEKVRVSQYFCRCNVSQVLCIFHINY